MKGKKLLIEIEELNKHYPHISLKPNFVIIKATTHYLTKNNSSSRKTTPPPLPSLNARYNTPQSTKSRILIIGDKLQANATYSRQKTKETDVKLQL